MPVLTINLPEDIYSTMEELIKKGTAKSKREIVIKALKKAFELSIFEWKEPLIFIRGFRRAIVNQRSINNLLSNLSKKQLVKGGREMGKTMVDSCLANFGVDPRKKENWGIAFKILSQIGWGHFKLENGKIIVQYPFFPKELLQGYLEEALGVSLEQIQTTDEIAIFKIKKE